MLQNFGKWIRHHSWVMFEVWENKWGFPVFEKPVILKIESAVKSFSSGKITSPECVHSFRSLRNLSPRQLPHSFAFSRVISRFMASGDVSLSKIPCSPRTNIIEENIDTVRNLVEEKPNSFNSRASRYHKKRHIICSGIKLPRSSWNQSWINSGRT